MDGTASGCHVYLSLRDGVVSHAHSVGHSMPTVGPHLCVQLWATLSSSASLTSLSFATDLHDGVVFGVSPLVVCYKLISSCHAWYMIDDTARGPIAPILCLPVPILQALVTGFGL